MHMLLPRLWRDALDRTFWRPESVRRVAWLCVVISALMVIWTALPPDDRVTQLVSSYTLILGGLRLLAELIMDVVWRCPQRWRIIRRMTHLSVLLMLIRVGGPFLVAWAEADPAAVLAFGLALLLVQALVFSGSLATTNLVIAGVPHSCPLDGRRNYAILMR
jgi:hypothetical protein